jgi:hypothetical protein
MGGGDSKLPLWFVPSANAAADPLGEGAGEAMPTFHGSVHARALVAVVGNAMGDVLPPWLAGEDGPDRPPAPTLVLSR